MSVVTFHPGRGLIRIEFFFPNRDLGFNRIHEPHGGLKRFLPMIARTPDGHRGLSNRHVAHAVMNQALRELKALKGLLAKLGQHL